MKHVIELLEIEKAKIQSAIDALTGGAAPKRRGRPPGSVNKTQERVSVVDRGEKGDGSTLPTPISVHRKKRVWTKQQRAEVAARIRKMWAAKRRDSKKAA